jgi:hypothetical protein
MKIKTRISLSNPGNLALSPIGVEAIVDTGAMHLCIPEHIAVQLQLTEMYKREVIVADGRRTYAHMSVRSKSPSVIAVASPVPSSSATKFCSAQSPWKTWT